MPAQADHGLALSLCAALLIPLALTGCCRRCTDDQCTPRSPWQSPTIQATRSLLLVNRQELRILRIDGRRAHPTCVGDDGVREYHLTPGEHNITAVFRYAAPPGEGLLADVQGLPLTRTHTFLAGRAYVAYYHEHRRAKPEQAPEVADIATNARNPQEMYWSLEIINLAEGSGDLGPEVRDARAYGNWVNGFSATWDKQDSR